MPHRNLCGIDVSMRSEERRVGKELENNTCLSFVGFKDHPLPCDHAVVQSAELRIVGSYCNTH